MSVLDYFDFSLISDTVDEKVSEGRASIFVGERAE